ncbi:MAG: hypothetical protein NDJ89_06265 [Oligoflexia bacterium]|nr:hypothetical protein [Oligoflexia bacterium]
MDIDSDLLPSTGAGLLLSATRREPVSDEQAFPLLGFSNEANFKRIQRYVNFEYLSPDDGSSA